MCNYLRNHTYTKKVKKVYVHPKFPGFLYSKMGTEDDSYDIALLEIQPFDLSEEINVLPGCLFEWNDLSFDGPLLIAGWFSSLAWLFSVDLINVLSTLYF